MAPSKTKKSKNFLKKKNSLSSVFFSFLFKIHSLHLLLKYKRKAHFEKTEKENKSVVFLPYKAIFNCSLVKMFLLQCLTSFEPKRCKTPKTLFETKDFICLKKKENQKRKEKRKVKKKFIFVTKGFLK